MSDVLLQKSIEETVQISHVLFPVFEHQDMEDLSFFTEAEIALMKKKIHASQEDGKYSGGKYLLKQLHSIELSKQQLLKFVENIRESLKPREYQKAKVNVQEVIDSTTEKAIRDSKYSFKLLDEKILREVAKAMIGEGEWKYTVDELPLVLATKQITNRLIEPEDI